MEVKILYSISLIFFFRIRLKGSIFFQPLVRADSIRTEYVPQVKILRRPQDKCLSSPTLTIPPTTSPTISTIAIDPNKPYKSIEERETEYYRARQRIFDEMEENNKKTSISSENDSTWQTL